MKKQNLLIGISTAAVGFMAPLLAQAQSAPAGDTLEEIVVTAERREADVQKTAVSVAVRDGDDMVREGKSSLAQMLEDVPGVTVPAGLIGAAPNDNPGGGVVIRGVAPNGVLPGDSGVATTGLYTDGVYQGLGGDYDLGRLEVLRGPQGTLYGRSATSGVVAAYTNDPKLGRWGADVNLEYGSFALQHVSGAVNVPVGDDLAVRVSGNILKQNSTLDGSKYGGAHEEDAGRVKLLYHPNDDVSLLLGFAVQGDIVGQGGASGTLSAPDTITITQGPTATPVTDVFRQYWAQLNWNLGFGTLTYIPALRTFSSDSPSVLNALPFFEQNISNDYKKDQIHTEELRLASNAGSSVTWIAGAWFYNRDYDYDETVIWEPSGGFSHEPHIIKTTTNVALFGEATFALADTWRLTTGVRFDRTHTNSQDSTYTFNASEGSCNGNPFSFTPPVCTPTSADWALPNNLTTSPVPAGLGIRTQNNFTYKLRLEKDLTPANLLYVMGSSGFLPGDLSVGQSRLTAGGPLSLVAFNYDPEKLNSFEIGSKNRFYGNRFQLNGSVYYYDYKDYQMFINLNPGTPAPYFIVAASPAKMFGAELETLWQVSSNDRLGLSGGYTNARFVDKPTLFATYVAQDKIPGIAPFTAQGSYDHRFTLPQGSTLSFGVDAVYRSSYDENALSQSEVLTTNLEDYINSGSQYTGNARLTWSAADGKLSVTGYVRNVTDKVYKTAASDQYNVTPSAPRVYGLVLHASVD